MTNIQDGITLINGYYSHLLLSIYIDFLMKEGKIPLPQKNIQLPFHDQHNSNIQTKRIGIILEQIKKNPSSKNVYGYIASVSSIKGILSVFLDMHARYTTWKTYIKKLLGGRYENYILSIRIIRNTLTHQYSPDFRLSHFDISLQHDTLAQLDKRIVSYTFHYKEIFQSLRTGPETYGFHVSINTNTIFKKRKLYDIIDEQTLYMLAESIYTISSYFKKEHK